MTIHRYHPDPARGDPDDPVLWDNCERCREHAEDPRSLDAENFRRLLDVIVTGKWPDRPTENERLAESQVWRALLIAERVASAYRGELVTWQEFVGVPVGETV